MRQPAVLALGLALAGLVAGGPAAAAGRVIPLGSEDRAALALLGEGVLGEAVPASVLDPGRFVHLRPGRWTYRVVTGSHDGETEVERFEPAPRSPLRPAWVRSVGADYVLQISGTADGSLVMPRESVLAHGVVVHFEPALTYVLSGLRPGERRSAESRMTVYNAEPPGAKRYSGRITSATTYVGAYRVRTPAGRFEAALIRTDYTIEVFGVVTVKDVLHTLYAPGVGKVAETERRRVTALFMPMPAVERAKVLVEWTAEDVVEATTTPPAARQEAPRRRSTSRRPPPDGARGSSRDRDPRRTRCGRRRA